MGVVQLPDAVQRMIDRQVAEGRAASEAEFLAEAVQRYAHALESDEDRIVAAADLGMADMAAGRFEIIDGPEQMRRLTSDLSASLDTLGRHGR